MNLSIEDLLSIPHREVHGLDGLELTKQAACVSTDSRADNRGAFFFALRGEKFDGHDYLEAVAEAGALVGIVDAQWMHQRSTSELSMPVVVVEDTLVAFGELANVYREKFKIPILAIAGSNGKTTTKELVAHVLAGSMSVLKTEANYNNQIGVPRMLFQLRETHKVAVLEIGTNHPGELAALCKILRPTMALVTNIGREHLEYFHDLDGVAREEMAAFDAVKANDGFAFVNVDDVRLRHAQEQFKVNAIAYSAMESASTNVVVVRRETFDDDGLLLLSLQYDGSSVRFRTHLIADYAANVMAAAAAVAIHFKIPTGLLIDRLETFRPHDKRLQVSRIDSGVTVINDAYNANPDSMEAAMRTLRDFPTRGKRYLVVGDMFELGTTSEREHVALGKVAASFTFEAIFFVGEKMKLAFDAYRDTRAEMDSASQHFASKRELAMALRKLLRPEDVVLIKGSRGMRMEEIIDLLAQA